MELNPDTILDNHIRIINKLGQGGMGAVYLAYDMNLDYQVAVKVNRNPTPESTSQFLREGRLLATLRHPNLPRVVDYFVIGDDQFLVMDFIPGEDLAERVKREGPQRVETTLHWASELGSALIYMHQQKPPIIHRDIKPGNIKLNENGEAMLVDFGIAKIADPSQATSTGAAGYTPGFAPPEQYSGAGTGTYSDQFSLAATIYSLLTGQRPADSVQRMLGQITLTPIRAFKPEISQEVENAIYRAMSVRPEERFPNMAEFIAALTGEEPKTAKREIISQKPPEPPKKKASSWGYFLGGFFGILILGLIGISIAAVVLPNFIRPIRPDRPVLTEQTLTTQTDQPVLKITNSPNPTGTPTKKNIVANIAATATSPAEIKPTATIAPTQALPAPTNTPTIPKKAATNTPAPTKTDTPIPPSDTPIPPTDTIEPTESATIPPKPTEKTILFEDDFSNTDKNWPVNTNKDFSILYYRDGFRILIKTINYFAVSAMPGPYKNIRAEVDLYRRAGPDNGYMGLICRYQDINNLYGFWIDPSGYYGIYKRVEGKVTQISPERQQKSLAIQKENARNHLSIDCNGNLLTLRVNGKKLAEGKDDSFQEGTVGLMAGNLDKTSMDAIFDNILITNLGGN